MTEEIDDGRIDMMVGESLQHDSVESNSRATSPTGLVAMDDLETFSMTGDHQQHPHQHQQEEPSNGGSSRVRAIDILCSSLDGRHGLEYPGTQYLYRLVAERVCRGDAAERLSQDTILCLQLANTIIAKVRSQGRRFRRRCIGTGQLEEMTVPETQRWLVTVIRMEVESYLRRVATE